jgi:DNA/RNA-binding protein KIN17
MTLVGEDPRKYINGFSNDFQRDFVNLLRVAHGEKFIGANRFYNEYIRDKEHIHMNATKWASLTEFVKHLGREGIVNVKEDEKDGLMIAWRDTSVEAVRRREEIREKELAEARNGAGEDKMLMKMLKRAKEEAEARAKARSALQKPTGSQSPTEEGKTPDEKASPQGQAGTTEKNGDKPTNDETPKPEPAPVKISFGLKPKTLPQNKPGLGAMKSQSIFKRARTENGEENAGKKVKL